MSNVNATWCMAICEKEEIAQPLKPHAQRDLQNVDNIIISITTDM